MTRHDLRASAAERRLVLIQSFSAASLRRIHALDPALPLIQLFASGTSRKIQDALGGVNDYAVGIGPAKGSVDRALVERAHALCLDVHPYTVNEPGEQRAMIAVRVDGMFTNFPRELRAVLATAAPDTSTAVSADVAERSRCRRASGRRR